MNIFAFQFVHFHVPGSKRPVCDFTLHDVSTYMTSLCDLPREVTLQRMDSISGVTTGDAMGATVPGGTSLKITVKTPHLF